LVETIKEWNEQPSYPNKIATAFALVGLISPPGSLLSHRHRLMHDGSFKLKSDKAFEFFIDLHFHVLLLLLTMLGYEGFFFSLDKGEFEVTDFKMRGSEDSVDPA